MPPHIHALVRVVRRIVSWDGHMAFGANGCGRAGGTGVGARRRRGEARADAGQECCWFCPWLCCRAGEMAG